MHDGDPAYFRYTTIIYLETACTRQWTARQVPVSWSSRSPHPNPLDFSFGDIQKLGLCFSSEYCRGTAAISAKWLYLSPQHSWHFSAYPSNHEASRWSSCHRTWPTFSASTAILTISVTSHHWNLNYIFSKLLHYYWDISLLLLIWFVWQMFNPRCINYPLTLRLLSQLKLYSPTVAGNTMMTVWFTVE
jgi:hypothetical protein